MAAGYNEILDQARTEADLEALVLLHEDTEITDPDFPAKVRAELSDPATGMVGVLGAQGVTHLAYWRADVHGRVVETRGTINGRTVAQGVDAIDGLLMILSPWTVRHVRFDERRFTGFHGYDVDFSFAVRAAGRRVTTADIAVHHHTKGGYGDVGAYLRASRAWRRKWLASAPLRVRIEGLGVDVRLVMSVALHRLGLWRNRFSVVTTHHR